jgi:hypothetical protein
MASKLLQQAANALKAKTDAARRLTREKQKETALIAGGLTGTGLAAAAAISDQKLGKGDVYTWGPVPVNMIAGAVVLIPAFFTGKMPVVQAASAQGGMTLFNIGLYNLIRKHVDAGQ